MTSGTSYGRTALELAASLAGTPGLCLLDTALGAGLSRVFWSPVAELSFKNGAGELRHRDGHVETIRSDPFHWLAGWLEAHPGLVATGYWGYDLRYALERLPRRAIDDLQLPDCRLGIYPDPRVYELTPDEAASRSGKSANGRGPESDASAIAPGVDSSFSRTGYEAAVRRILDYIAAGDCYQVNLSQRFEAPFAGDSWALYRRLRSVSPAPYAAYMDWGDHQVLSSSPELFLKVEDGEVETRPIKGTRRRGITPEEDHRIAQELLGSDKDRAELLMIVDLERNDLGRVCEFGTVHVPELFRLESYSNVHHLVATVRGRLRRGLGPLDALRAAYPGGSITGAPKIRAMEIIEELEPVCRGVYTGAIGWVDGKGRGEWNIAIRTMVIKGGRVYFHAGGGIVADSDPADEYQETLTKASGMMEAILSGGDPPHE